MKKYFSVSEAAGLAHTTSETLRHYDRIGLVRPGRKDAWTKYRYYTESDIVRLQTVRALQLMDLPLAEIKKILEYDDLEKIMDALSQAERRADEKIAALRESKAKIALAKADYARKMQGRRSEDGVFVRALPARVILLSDTLQAPALENLWNYLSHFYEKLGADKKEQFSFEDLAGIYTENGVSRLFAQCIRYTEAEGLRTLPAGNYLCARCTEEAREEALRQLLRRAETDYGATPDFTVQTIIVSGVLHWDYEVQVYVG